MNGRRNRGDEMFHIIICDDDESFCSKLEESVLRTGKALNEKFDVGVFYSAEKFYEYLQAGNHVDLVFLDIDFPGKNGMEIGDLIRNDRKDESIMIVYVSSKIKYIIELFKNRPFNFLEKPLDTSKLERTLQEALELSSRTKQKFDYILSKKQHSIWCRDILYFRSEGRKVKLVNTGEPLIFYDHLSAIEERLQSSDFLRIHQSYLINLLYVKVWKYDRIQMADGEWLPVSKIHQSKIREIHVEYMKGKQKRV